MKKIILLGFLFIAGMACAQNKEYQSNYVSSGLSLGSHCGIHLNLNNVFKEKYSLQVGYSSLIRNSSSLPVDYNAGLSEQFAFGCTKPYEQINSYEILFGRAKMINEGGTIRLILKGGLAYSIVKEPVNWEKIEVNYTFVTANYTYDYDKISAFGIVVNPEVEFLFSRVFGLSLSPYIILNQEQIAYGISIKTLFGKLRRENRKITDESEIIVE